MSGLVCVDSIANLALGEWRMVEPVHCHQRLAKNTLVRRVRYVSADKTRAEADFKFDPQELEFFFDHAIDHLPGMLETNAMRQATLALAHLIYEVPGDYVALLDWMNLRMFNYGELDTSTQAKSRLLKASRSAHKITLTLDGLMMQGEFPVMRATGKLVMLSPAFAGKIRYKKLRQDDMYRKEQWISP